MKNDLHLPGGNRFDNMRINIAAAYVEQETRLGTVSKSSVRRSAFGNYARLGVYVALRYARLHELLVNNAVVREWYSLFAKYWVNVLGGRPLTVMDFHQLRFHYRMKNQAMVAFDWNDGATHLENWQAPENITFTLQLLYRQALNPVRARLLWRHLKPGMRALEYGCALAPMYQTWRQFLSHRRVNWTLADIANFPFHYTRELYGKDAECQLMTIGADRLDDPLAGSEGRFDVIFIQEVFEHLHRPLHIARYLIDRLNPGGLLVFDYIRSEASGLDTPAGLAQRGETLALIGRELEIIEGDFRQDDESLGVCIGRRR